MAVTTWTANTASFTPVTDALARFYAFDKRTISARSLLITPLWFLAKGPRGRHVRTPILSTITKLRKEAWKETKQLGRNVKEQGSALLSDLRSRILKRKEKVSVKEPIEEYSARHRAQ